MPTPRFLRALTPALAPALALAGVAAALPSAAQSGPYFRAELAEPAGQDQAVAGGVLFRCEGTVCTAPRSRSRPLRVCSDLRREVGTITAFTVAGEAMDTSRLARCNG